MSAKPSSFWCRTFRLLSELCALAEANVHVWRKVTYCRHVLRTGNVFFSVRVLRPCVRVHPRLARWNVLLSRFADPLPTHERLILFPSVAPLRPFPSTEDAMEGLASQVQVTFRVVRFHPPRMSRESSHPPRVPPPITLDGDLLWRSPTRVTLFSLRWTFILFRFCSAGGVQIHENLYAKKFRATRLFFHSNTGIVASIVPK